MNVSAGSRFLLAALLLVASPPVLALDPGKSIAQYVHDVWQTEQGLPQNSVNALVQTRDGYLWLGTEEGLVRFDGVRFTVFDVHNTPELGHNWVISLLEDRRGRLWIGTSGGGLSCLSAGRFTRKTKSDGLPGDQVSALLEDRGGRLWAGTLGGGLALLSGERFVPQPLTGGKRVRALLEDRQGTIWVGTDAGLLRLDDGLERVTEKESGLSRQSVVALRETRDGSLWVGTEGRGLHRLRDGNVVAVLTTRDGLSNDVIWSLREDRDGNLWIGTDGGGLDRLTNGKVTSFTTRQGLSNDFVYSLCEDREGTLWIGTDGGGLNRLVDGKVTTLATRDGLTTDITRALLADRDGALWVGTDGRGLQRLKDGVVTTLTTKDGLSNDFVRALCADREGGLWVGTRGGGVSRLKDGRFTSIGSKQGLSSDLVRSLYEDRAGTLWIGTDGGLDGLRDGVITHFTTKEGLSNDLVQALLEDRAGALWIGTRGGGLNRLKDGKLTALTTRDGLSNDSVYALHEDAEGTLWIGTQGGGLSRLKDGRLTSVTTRQGLYDDIVYAIAEDDQGRLWMSCNKGLFQVRTSELKEVLDGKRPRVTSVSYGTADGMKSAECNGAGQPVVVKGRDGKLYFPTIRGVVVVDPARLSGSTLPPPVVVEEVILDQRPARPETDASAGLHVPPGTGTVEVRYTALSLTNPGRVRFRYRMEGFDDTWVDAGTRRTAYFTRLPHGSYRFRVLACNADGVWNEEGGSLAITVEPRLYEAGWFRLLAAIALVGSLAAAYRVRLSRLRARERELVALVDERTRGLADALSEAEAQKRRAEDANLAKSVFLASMSHELRTPLNGVLGFAQLMGRRSGRDEVDHQHLRTIQRSGEHLLGLINDVLSLSKIEAGRIASHQGPFDLVALLTGLVDLLRLRAEAKGLTLTLVRDPGLPSDVVGDEGRLRQILLNLLGNAVKFTTTGGVTLRASWAEGHATFEVADTGPGIAPSEIGALFQPFVQTETGRRSNEGTGLGLALSRQLARLMGGDVTVTSEVGRGSVFRVTIALVPTTPSEGAERGDRRKVVGLAPGQPAYRVLVVDDVADNRTLLAGLLGSVGFQVKEAGDGEDAIATWRSWAPHLVWMDKRMPGLDGLEVTRRIRAEESARGGGRRTPILALSASALDHERAEILAAGFDDFLAKPFREEALYEMTARYLGARYDYAKDETSPAPAASDETPLTRRDLEALPHDLLDRLRQALDEADAEAARRIVDEELRPLDGSVADRLGTLLRAYRLDEIEALLGPPDDVLRASLDP